MMMAKAVVHAQGAAGGGGKVVYVLRKSRVARQRGCCGSSAHQEVKICGSAAYVSQSSWIQSGYIEENILFGTKMLIFYLLDDPLCALDAHTSSELFQVLGGRSSRVVAKTCQTI